MHVITSMIFEPTMEPRSIDLRAHFLTRLPSAWTGITKSGKPTKMRHSVGSMWFVTANHMIKPIETNISNGAIATSDRTVDSMICICCGSDAMRVITCPMSTRPKNSSPWRSTWSKSSCLMSATACAPDQLRQ